MTKKILCVVLATLMAVSLFGCKKDEYTHVTDSTVVTEPSEVTENTTPVESTGAIDDITNPTDFTEATEGTEPIETTVHVHDWTDNVIVPTCTEDGYTERACSVCGEKTREFITSPNGHSWGEWKTIVKPTAEIEGKDERVCSVCNSVETRTLAKVSANDTHEHNYVSTVTNKSTCYQAGVKTFKCSCGDTFTEDIPKTAHTYKDTTIKPTCLLRGYTEHTCSVCKNSYRDNYVDVVSHNYKAIVTNPTCTNDGYTTYKCEYCGNSRVRDKVPSTGHDYVVTVTKPTCVKDGYTTNKCKKCGDSFVSDKVSSKGHDYQSVVTAPTCTDGGYTTYTCSSCKDVNIGNKVPAKGHSYVVSVVNATCTTDGYSLYKCNNCGYSEIGNKTNSKGHNWLNWVVTKQPAEHNTGLKVRECFVCGEKESEILPKVVHVHNYSKTVTKPTCTSDGFTTYTCKCGDAYTDNKVYAVGHNYTSKVVKASCTQNGYTIHTCEYCGESFRNNTVVAFGHSWTAWSVTKEATENDTGLKERGCTTCGKRESITIPKLQHTHSYKVTATVSPTCENTGSRTETCSCGDSRTIVIPVLTHQWIYRHEDAVGHYESRVVCHCGKWSCSDDNYVVSFGAHVESLPVDERFEHSYYTDTKWIVDVPAKDWKECSACGKVEYL